MRKGEVSPIPSGVASGSRSSPSSSSPPLAGVARRHVHWRCRLQDHKGCRRHQAALVKDGHGGRNLHPVLATNRGTMALGEYSWSSPTKTWRATASFSSDKASGLRRSLSSAPQASTSGASVPGVEPPAVSGILSGAWPPSASPPSRCPASDRRSSSPAPASPDRQ